MWENFPQDIDTERGRIIRGAMASREVVRGETFSLVGRYISYVIFPLGDGLGVFFRDITDRRNAERQRDEAEEALRKRSAELEAVLETIPTAVWFTTDPELRNVVGNRRATELLRMAREADLSSTLNHPDHFAVFRDGNAVPPEARPLHRAARGEIVNNELLEVRFADGDRKMILMRAAPLRTTDGAIQGAVCAAADVTERHRYEEHLKLLLNELEHRIKNTLSIVLSIATQTFGKGLDPALRAAFEDRIVALSNVHGVLTRHWDSADLQEVMLTALRPHQARTASASPSRADAAARPEERGGAVDGGARARHQRNEVRRAVGRRGGDDRLERRGRALSPALGRKRRTAGGTPHRTGFGSRMIERGLAAELQGAARSTTSPPA